MVPGPIFMIFPRPESLPGSPDSLFNVEALLGLPNRAVAPEEEEEDLDLAGLF
jgi:hypothetical protein